MRKKFKIWYWGILGLASLVACQVMPPPVQTLSRQPFPTDVFHRQTVQAQIPAQAEVELGFRLFFEPRLSADNRMTCATCHQPGKGFSNGEPTAAGVTGVRGHRNTPTIYTMAVQRSLFWDGRAATLEEQALGPIQNPIEMNETLDHVIAKLNQVPYYVKKFQTTFQTPINAAGIAKALASFERALELQASPYDRFIDGDLHALTPAQERGLQLFSRQAHCGACHKGLDLTDHKFHNLGVGLNGPKPDLGRFEVTKRPEDWGAFKTPTLRNLSQSAPYMHDGSMQTLEEVIDFYDQGGHPNPNLDPEMGRLHLSPQDKQDLLAFLKALDSPGDNLKEIARLPGVVEPGLK